MEDFQEPTFKLNLRTNSNLALFFFGSQVHEMTMVSAIQEAQKDNLRSFNDYMLHALEVGMILKS